MKREVCLRVWSLEINNLKIKILIKDKIEVKHSWWITVYMISLARGVTGLLVLQSADGYETAADITYKVSIYIIII